MKRQRSVDDELDRLLSRLIRRCRALERAITDGTIAVLDALPQALRLRQLADELAALQRECSHLREEAPAT